jgi:hypothetical protein
MYRLYSMRVFKMLLKKNDVIFEVLCFVIVIISAIDLYFIGKTRDVIEEHEQNPIGTYLISLDSGDISIFITAKFLGTMLALYFLIKLRRLRFKHIILVTSVIAVAQIALLIYLFM